MDRPCVARGEPAHADDTNEEDSGEKRQSFLAKSRLGANVQLPTLNVQCRIES
jgi:hypothetical protein